jgi:hypothetical protein
VTAAPAHEFHASEVWTPDLLADHGWVPGEWGCVIPWDTDPAVKPTEIQSAAIESDRLNVMLRGGTGTGKTRTMTYMFGNGVLENGPAVEHGLIGRTFRQMKGPLLRAIKDTLRRAMWVNPDGEVSPFVQGNPTSRRVRDETPDWEWHAGDMMLHVKLRGCFGADYPMIRLESADENRLTSYEWATVGADELARWRRSAYDASLGRWRGNGPYPRYIGSTTPNGLNWYYDLFNATQGDIDWTWVRQSAYEAHWAPEHSIRLRAKLYSEALAAQELAGEFLMVGEGLAFPKWSDANLLHREDPRADWKHVRELFVSIDWGGTNFAQAISNFLYGMSQDENKRVVRKAYFRDHGSAVADYARAFIRDFRHRIFDDEGGQIREVVIDGDPQCEGETGHGKTLLSLYTDELDAAGITWSHRLMRRKTQIDGKWKWVANPPDPRNRLEWMATMIEKGRLLVIACEDTEPLLRDIVQATYGADGRKLDKGEDQRLGHLVDGLSYSLFGQHARPPARTSIPAPVSHPSTRVWRDDEQGKKRKGRVWR